MADDKTAAPEPFRLQFHYIKGPDYREVACHGMIGGPTPPGKLWIALFSERTPIPRMVEYHLPPPAEGATGIQFEEGSAGTPNVVESRQGVIRHVEFSAYLDIDVAERIQQWLGVQIAQLKSKLEKSGGGK